MPLPILTLKDGKFYLDDYDLGCASELTLHIMPPGEFSTITIQIAVDLGSPFRTDKLG